MSDDGIKQTKPKRYFRWRIAFAILLSALLHLALIPDIIIDDPTTKPLVIKAILTSNTSAQSDNRDVRGEITANGKRIQTASAPKTNISSNPPKTLSTLNRDPIKSPQQPKQSPRPQKPNVAKTAKKPSKKENTTKKIIPKHDSSPVPETETRTESNLQAQHQGAKETFSNPIEQAYYETLMAHLNSRLPAHPLGIAGQVRLQVKIQYNAIITSSTVIDSSGHLPTDEWAIRALLSVSPVPEVPIELAQPYYFRPTLILTD